MISYPEMTKENAERLKELKKAYKYGYRRGYISPLMDVEVDGAFLSCRFCMYRFKTECQNFRKEMRQDEKEFLCTAFKVNWKKLKEFKLKRKVH